MKCFLVVVCVVTAAVWRLHKNNTRTCKCAHVYVGESIRFVVEALDFVLLSFDECGGDQYFQSNKKFSVSKILKKKLLAIIILLESRVPTGVRQIIIKTLKKNFFQKIFISKGGPLWKFLKNFFFIPNQLF